SSMPTACWGPACSPRTQAGCSERARTKGTFFIVAARRPVCGEAVCLERLTYQENYERPFCTSPLHAVMRCVLMGGRAHPGLATIPFVERIGEVKSCPV